MKYAQNERHAWGTGTVVVTLRLLAPILVSRSYQLPHITHVRLCTDRIAIRTKLYLLLTLQPDLVPRWQCTELRKARAGIENDRIACLRRFFLPAVPGVSRIDAALNRGVGHLVVRFHKAEVSV